MRYKRKSLEAGLFFIAVLGSFLSYTESGRSSLKLIGYGLSFGALAVLALMSNLSSNSRVFTVLGFGSIIGLSTAFSMLTSPTAGSTISVIQDLLYPFTIVLLVLVGFRLPQTQSKALVTSVVLLAFVNAAVALGASFGLIRSLPLFGEIETGRYIFGTRIPSSSGLNHNVNYYATAQASLFFLYGWLQQSRKGRFSRADLFILLLLFVSTLIGSSRGILGASVAALLVQGIVVVLGGPRATARRALALLSVLAIFAVAAYFNYTDEIHSVLRVERGLNYRDVIWAAGLDLWLQRPIFGWGADFGNLLGEVGPAEVAGRSLHSGYLHTLVRGGIVLFISTFGLIFLTVFWGLGLDKQLWYRHRWPLSIIVFYLISTLARTYSIGGLGVLPMLLGFAMSTCFYARSKVSNPSRRPVVRDGPVVAS